MKVFISIYRHAPVVRCLNNTISLPGVNVETENAMCFLLSLTVGEQIRISKMQFSNVH